MSWDRRKGLGIGCGVLVLIGALLAGGGVWFARQMSDDYKLVRAGEEALHEAYGLPDQWAPPNLVPAPERVEAFLTVRRDLAEWQVLLATGVVRMAALGSQDGNPLKRFVERLQAGSEMASQYAGFWAARNQALLDVEMGAGEYIWLYHLAYHAWLGMDPAEGAAQPGFGSPDGQGPRDHDYQARQRLRHLVTGMLERGIPPVEEERTWRAEELGRLAADPTRYPWQTDLPLAVAEAFAAHRMALEASWSPLVNPVELLFEVEETAPGE